MYVCSACMYEYAPWVCLVSLRASCSLGTGVTDGSEPGSSARGASILNCWAISPAPKRLIVFISFEMVQADSLGLSTSWFPSLVLRPEEAHLGNLEKSSSDYLIAQSSLFVYLPISHLCPLLDKCHQSPNASMVAWAPYPRINGTEKRFDVKVSCSWKAWSLPTRRM